MKLEIKIVDVTEPARAGGLASVLTDECGREVRTAVSAERAERLSRHVGSTVSPERFVELCGERIEG